MKISDTLRMKMERTKEELKKSIADDLCRQMDSIFTGVISELETEAIKEEKSCASSSTENALDTGLFSSEEDSSKETVFDEKETAPLALKPIDQHDIEIDSRELKNSAGKRSYRVKIRKERQFKTIYSEVNQVNCPIDWCDGVFLKRHEFVLHFYEFHNEVSSLHCFQCQMIMWTPWEMFMHELLYHNEGLFGCTKENCSFNGATRSAVLAHYDMAHLGRLPRRPQTPSMSLHFSPPAAPPMMAFEPNQYEYQYPLLSPVYGYDSNFKVAAAGMVDPKEIYGPFSCAFTDPQMSGFLY